MAIRKIVARSLGDGSVTKADLDVASSTGTGAILPPTGTTIQRPTPAAAQLRFNTTLNLMEYYDGTIWKSIDSPPLITSISGQINENTDSTLTITGSNFQSGAVVYISGAAVSNIDRALTTTFVSSTQVTAATNATAVNYVGGANFDVKVTNTSGLSGILAAAGAVDRDPTWTTASGSIGNIYDSGRGSVSFSVVATDPESTAVTYALTTGSLPTGLSLNTSTGAITGSTSAVGSDTTTTFSITPTSNGQAGVARSFSITQKAPVVTSFTATGSSTFSVPTGITTLKVLVVAGGGSGGGRYAGGGGGGGVVVHSSYPVTPGGTVSYTVGAGASAASAGSNNGNDGSNSVFGTMTANGGGGGGKWNDGGVGAQPGRAGGSGGGGGAVDGSGSSGSGGPSNQTPSGGGTGYGYPGGGCTPGTGPTIGGGGGGGGGAIGGTGTASGGAGGAGYTWPVNSTTYAGGGGGGACLAVGSGGAGGSGGGGAGGLGGTNNPTGSDGGVPGTTNRGGGGGGNGGTGNGYGGPTAPSGSGGPGIIIVSY